MSAEISQVCAKKDVMAGTYIAKSPVFDLLRNVTSMSRYKTRACVAISVHDSR